MHAHPLPTGFGCGANSVLIFCSITEAVSLAMGLYNAPAWADAVSSVKIKLKKNC